MHPVSSPDRMGVGINQPCNNKELMTDLMEAPLLPQKIKKIDTDQAGHTSL